MTSVPKGMLVGARDFRWSGSDGPVVFFARGLRRVLTKMPRGEVHCSSTRHLPSGPELADSISRARFSDLLI